MTPTEVYTWYQVVTQALNQNTIIYVGHFSLSSEDCYAMHMYMYQPNVCTGSTSKISYSIYTIAIA